MYIHSGYSDVCSMRYYNRRYYLLNSERRFFKTSWYIQLTYFGEAGTDDPDADDEGGLDPLELHVEDLVALDGPGVFSARGGCGLLIDGDGHGGRRLVLQGVQHVAVPPGGRRHRG